MGSGNPRFLVFLFLETRVGFLETRVGLSDAVLADLELPGSRKKLIRSRSGGWRGPLGHITGPEDGHPERLEEKHFVEGTGRDLHNWSSAAIVPKEVGGSAANP